MRCQSLHGEIIEAAGAHAGSKNKIAPVVQDTYEKAKANPDKAKEISQEIKKEVKARITPEQQTKLANFKECD